MLLALWLGATFVARSFSGDKAQLVPILKAALEHRGFALVDVISPCVSFNDHEGSTKSYRYTREHDVELVQTDFVPFAAAIRTDYEAGDAVDVRMHSGHVRLRKTDDSYDPTDRDRVYAYLRERQAQGELPTGLLYIDASASDMHGGLNTVDEPLSTYPFEKLCPGKERLEELMEGYR